MKVISKEEALKQMVQDDGENCLVYVLQRIEEVVSSINYKDGKWYYELWNDYQDYSIYKKYISEELALSYINAPTPLDSEVEEAINEMSYYLTVGMDNINFKKIDKPFNTIRQALKGKHITITKLTKTITLMTKDLNELNDLNDILEHTNNYLIDVREHNHNLMR